MDSVSLDTSYAIALAIKQNVYTEPALQLADQIEEECVPVATTRPVVFEIDNYL